MLIYFINIVVILFIGISLLVYKPTKIKKIIFLSISFLQMFLLSVFRLNIGYDYQMYVEGFYRMAMSGFSDMNYLDWEIGFVLFTKIVAFFTLNHYIYLGIISFFCLGSSAYFIYKNSKMVCLSTILFINLYFFYLNMNFLRQSIAISIILFSWSFLKRNKFIPYILIVLLAATFHSTALIMIPLYFIVKIKPTKVLTFLYCYGLLFFYISSKGFINLLTDIFYQDYKNSIFLQGLSFLYALLPILVLIVTIIFRTELLKANKYNQYLIHFVYLTTFLMIIMSRHAILERLSYYSYIFFIIIIPEIVVLSPNLIIKEAEDAICLEQPYHKRELRRLERKKQRIILLFTIIVLILTSAYNAYGMLEGVHGVFPYNK